MDGVSILAPYTLKYCTCNTEYYYITYDSETGLPYCRPDCYNLFGSSSINDVVDTVCTCVENYNINFDLNTCVADC